MDEYELKPNGKRYLKGPWEYKETINGEFVDYDEYETRVYSENTLIITGYKLVE